MAGSQGRWLSLTGIVAFVVLLASFMIAPMPPTVDDSVSEVTKYYSGNAGDIETAILVTTIGSWLYLLFICGFRQFLVVRGGAGEPYGTIAVVGAVISVAGWFAANSIVLALAQGSAKLGGDEMYAPLHYVVQHAMTVATWGDTLMYLAIALGILTTRALPAWLGWIAGIAAALVFVSNVSGSEALYAPSMGIGFLFFLAASIVLPMTWWRSTPDAGEAAAG